MSKGVTSRKTHDNGDGCWTSFAEYLAFSKSAPGLLNCCRCADKRYLHCCLTNTISQMQKTSLFFHQLSCFSFQNILPALGLYSFLKASTHSITTKKRVTFSQVASRLLQQTVTWNCFHFCFCNCRKWACSNRVDYYCLSPHSLCVCSTELAKLTSTVTEPQNTLRRQTLQKMFKTIVNVWLQDALC